MADLITVSELAVYMQRTLAVDNPAALAAIADVTADINVFCRQDVTTATHLQPWQIAAAKSVCKRAAARVMTNPDQRASFSGPDGLTYSGAGDIPGRILTGDEKLMLDPCVSFDDLYG